MDGAAGELQELSGVSVERDGEETVIRLEGLDSPAYSEFVLEDENVRSIALLEPLSQVLRGVHADQWFLYGFLYTVAVLVMGVRMFYRYRHNKYHLWRTASVMFFQLGFAFILPALLIQFNQPEFYFTYFWPLKPEYLFPSKIAELTAHPGGLL